MVTMIWIGIVAGLAVLVLMAVSDHLNDHAQPADRAPAPTPVESASRRPAATAVRPCCSAHLPNAA